MKFGIAVEDIMKKEFPVVDISQNLIDCANIVGDDNACIVAEKGNFKGMLSPREILKGFLRGDESIKKASLIKEIGVIQASSDVIYLIKMMEKLHLEFFIVKKDNNIVGVATKRDLSKIKNLANKLIAC